MAARKRRKRRTAAQKRATAKMVAANRRRRKGGRKVTRKRRVTRSSSPKRRRRRRFTVASPKRRKRIVARKRSGTRSRRRSRRRKGGSISFRRVRGTAYVRNPPIMKALIQGAKDAGLVVGGKAAVRIVSNMLPLPKDGIVGIGVQAGLALGLGMAASKFLGRDAARFVVAGALSAPIEAIAKTLPVIGPALADDDIGAYELMGDDPLPIGDLPIGEYEEVGEYVYS